MIYADYSATTKPYEEVLQSFVEVNNKYYANAASLHEFGVTSNKLLQRARQQIAETFDTTSESVVFTSGGTEANNLAIKGIVYSYLNRGKHIITSTIEHPSVLLTFQQLENEGFDVDYVNVDENGEVIKEDLLRLLRADTIFVSIMHVNNEIGAIQNIAELAKIIKTNSRAFFHVDAVQSAGKIPISMTEMNIDLLSISAHKMHGLKGSGALLWRGNVTLTPQVLGGNQENGLRSGTVAIANAVSLAKALRLNLQRFETEVNKYKQFRVELIDALKQISNVKVFAEQNGFSTIISFSKKGITGEVVVNALQAKGIIVSTSSACSSKTSKVSHVMKAINCPVAFEKGLVRVSIGNGTSDEEMKYLVENIPSIVATLKGE